MEGTEVTARLIVGTFQYEYEALGPPSLVPITERPKRCPLLHFHLPVMRSPKSGRTEDNDWRYTIRAAVD